MRKTFVLDARPLSQIVHPRKFGAISEWFDYAASVGHNFVVPEIVDYEVRRGLLRVPAPAQIERLDYLLKEGVQFDPITRPIMIDAAHVWAKARMMGKPFTSDDRLDGDARYPRAILAAALCAALIAQVRALGDPRNLAVVTENVQHLERFVPTTRWQDVEV